MNSLFDKQFAIHIPGETGRGKHQKSEEEFVAETVAEGKPENRALSIRQPWAEQILRGDKLIEYRSRPCKGMIGKRVYLYASARYDEGELDGYQDMGLERGQLPVGVVVGTMGIWKCTFVLGEYEWHIRNPERLTEPFKPANKSQPVWFRPIG